MDRWSGRLGRFISNTLYIVLGIVMALAINQGLALALSTDMPIVAVESNSMVPTFYKGDILVLQGVPPEQLKVGDIIVFSPTIDSQPRKDTGLFSFLNPRGSTPVVHRIVKINPDGTFQTKGDANSGQLPFEKRITPEQIHGKEILVIPWLGWIKLGITEYVIPNITWITPIALVFGLLYYGRERLRSFIKI